MQMMVHNGPYGLGNMPQDPCGVDFRGPRKDGSTPAAGTADKLLHLHSLFSWACCCPWSCKGVASQLG